MFGIGTGELLLIALIALLVLGPDRMPKLMRDVGKTMGDLRRTSDDLQREFMNSDRKLDPEKVLDAVTRPAPPDAVATQAAVTTEAAPAEPTPAEIAPAPPAPAEIPPPADAAPRPDPGETAFDREARLARERIARMG